MDFNSILNKAQSLNNARHIIEDNINDMVTNAIEERVKTNGFRDKEGFFSHPIPSQFMVEINSVNDATSYAHEVYYTPISKSVRVVCSWEIGIPDEDEDFALADLDLDEKIEILRCML